MHACPAPIRAGALDRGRGKGQRGSHLAAVPPSHPPAAPPCPSALPLIHGPSEGGAVLLFGSPLHPKIRMEAAGN